MIITRFFYLFSLFFLCHLIHFSLYSDELKNLKPLHTYKGQVLSVQKFSYVNRPVPYVQCLFRANGEDLTVELGPEWFLSTRGIGIVPRDELIIEGFFVSREGNTLLVATLIKKGNEQLRLRDAEGNPLWGAQRNLLQIKTTTAN